MKVLLIGYGNINKLISDNNSIEVVGIIQREKFYINNNPDIIIDFSHHLFIDETIKYANLYNVPVIIGTTGYTDIEFEKIKQLSTKVAVLLCENFSVGINLIKNMLNNNIEIINHFRKNIYETHRALKADIPSGTAIMLSDILKTNSIISYRVENVLGKHKIVLSSDYERVEIIHEILDRRVFSNNVIMIAKKLINKKEKLYTFEEILNE